MRVAIAFVVVFLFAGMCFAANTMPTQTYSFTIKTDTTAPSVSDKVPASGATGVDPMSPVSFHLIDTETGVNQSTIVLKINGTTVTPTITGTKNDYTVTYTPTTPFAYGSTVNVSVSASDLAQ